MTTKLAATVLECIASIDGKGNERGKPKTKNRDAVVNAGERWTKKMWCNESIREVGLLAPYAIGIGMELKQANRRKRRHAVGLEQKRAR